jgi:hypothetical protein
MLGINMPTQSSLSDLGTLLNLMQAASDPAKAKVVIATLAAERKKYDDAITDSVVRHKEAKAAIAEAAESVGKSEAAIIRLDKRSSLIATQTLNAKEDRETLAQERKELDLYKLQVAANALEQVRVNEERELVMAKRSAELDDRSKRMDKVLAKTTEAQEVALSARAEYETKLAQLKALTA